jgi:hypothetical protein
MDSKCWRTIFRPLYYLRRTIYWRLATSIIGCLHLTPTMPIDVPRQISAAIQLRHYRAGKIVGCGRRSASAVRVNNRTAPTITSATWYRAVEVCLHSTTLISQSRTHFPLFLSTWHSPGLATRSRGETIRLVPERVADEACVYTSLMCIAIPPDSTYAARLPHSGSRELQYGPNQPGTPVPKSILPIHYPSPDDPRRPVNGQVTPLLAG